MSLRSVITDIMERVALEVSSVTHSVGAREAEAHCAPPNVRWVPISDAIGPAPKRAASSDHLTRTIAGLDTSFRVLCWGADFDGAELLRDAVLRGCQYVAPSYALGTRGVWVESGAITEGELVELSVTLRGFVPESPSPTVATITTTDTTDTGVSS